MNEIPYIGGILFETDNVYNVVVLGLAEHSLNEAATFLLRAFITTKHVAEGDTGGAVVRWLVKMENIGGFDAYRCISHLFLKVSHFDSFHLRDNTC